MGRSRLGSRTYDGTKNGKNGKNGKRQKRSWHHIRPRSRGGQNKGMYRENEVFMDALRHNQLHVLFQNLRIAEIITLLLFHWTTVCPHEEARESHTYREQPGFSVRRATWDEFFGGNISRYEVIAAMVREFVITAEDKKQVRLAFERGLAAGMLQSTEAETLLHLLTS